MPHSRTEGMSLGSLVRVCGVAAQHALLPAAAGRASAISMSHFETALSEIQAQVAPLSHADAVAYIKWQGALAGL